MNLNLDLPFSIRVVATEDFKGSPRMVLLVDDMEVLYANATSQTVTEEATVDGNTADGWTDFFRFRLKCIIARLLKEEDVDDMLRDWTTETDRELSESVHDVWLSEEKED